MRLSKYRKSDINQVIINYRGKTFNFNIYSECSITEAGLEAEIKGQPSRYALLFTLHKKILADFERLKATRKRVYGRLLHVAKAKVGASGRPYTDEQSKAYVESHKKYLKATEDCLKTREDSDVLLGCVRAFEQRKDLLQTLASNLRKERI